MREEIKRQLNTLTKEEWKAKSDKIFHDLIGTEEWHAANTIGITISVGREVETLSIINEGWKQGKCIVVPKCLQETRELKFYQILSLDDLESSFYSLKEPIVTKTKFITKEEIDLLVVPGIAFDQNGYRIGYGGGYYDRFLVNFDGKTISLAFAIQVLSEVPHDFHDIPVKKIITEDTLIHIE